VEFLHHTKHQALRKVVVVALHYTRISHHQLSSLALDKW